MNPPYLRLGLAWEHVLADVVQLWRQSLITVSGRDTFVLPCTTTDWRAFGYSNGEIASARALVTAQIANATPRPNIVEVLSRLSRAIDRGECEVYIFASGFERAYKPIRRWVDAWGGKGLALVTFEESVSLRYSAEMLGLSHLIHTRASYPPSAIGRSILVDTPQFNQDAYQPYLVASLDAALAKAGFKG